MTRRPLAVALALTATLAAGSVAAQTAGGYSYVECVSTVDAQPLIYRLSNTEFHRWDDGRGRWRNMCRAEIGEDARRCEISMYEARSIVSHGYGETAFSINRRDGSARIGLPPFEPSRVSACRSTDNPETAPRMF